MFETQFTQPNVELWQQLLSHRQKFLTQSGDRLSILKEALHNPSERVTALQLCLYLTEAERQTLFDELVRLASVGHSDIELVRQTILSLPHSWLSTHIEAVAESLLEEGTDEEYRRLLELYINIDNHLAKRLIKRALQHQDPEIQEVGEDFEKHYNFNAQDGKY
ncbi:hypothetical protein [Gloeocapsa sp. PCC 73106]|uniref:hypothetical protein n=1 Tax=Gloeocapsa sp. PCC 73106 TaxID=102232 RepID=UPI0002ACA864|nr:hypothetical protein [Gloeocapsa sp. PCC 73106]ELR99403.1 hypothetical protein GLO73106DRAFT_00032540 [Gloeocapsa sp. PCC 73106]